MLSLRVYFVLVYCGTNKVSGTMLPQAMLLIDWKEIARLIHACIPLGEAWADGRPPSAKNACAGLVGVGAFFAAAAGLAA
jgi:hypothetical protein